MLESNFKRAFQAPKYTFRQNPLNRAAFMIMKRDLRAYEHIGDYIVLDKAESHNMSQKKVMNLVSLLNGNTDDVIDLRKAEECRGKCLLFQKLESRDPNVTKIMLRCYNGKQISQENAMIIMRDGPIMEKADSYA